MLNAKPFVIAEKIRNRLFKPAPNVIASVDINQEKEAIIVAAERVSDKLGAFSSGITTTVNNLVLTKNNSTDWDLDFDIDFGGSTPLIYAKTVAFKPWTNPVNDSYLVVGAVSPPIISWWLTAEKDIVTYASDPVMAGVNGPSFPSSVASSDAVVWKNEQLTRVVGTTLPTLTGNKEYICKVASIVYVDESKLNYPSDYRPVFSLEATDVTDLSSLMNTGFISMPAVNVEEVIKRMGYVLGVTGERITQERKFKDTLTVSSSTTFQNIDNQKLVITTGQTANIVHTMASHLNYKTGDSILFYNDGNWPVNIDISTNISVPNYVLPGKGDFVELVFKRVNSTTGSWSPADYKVFKAVQEIGFPDYPSSAGELYYTHMEKFILSLLTVNGDIILPSLSTIAGVGTHSITVKQIDLVPNSFAKGTLKAFGTNIIDGVASGSLVLNTGDCVELVAVIEANPSNSRWYIRAIYRNPKGVNYTNPTLTAGFATGSSVLRYKIDSTLNKLAFQGDIAFTGSYTGGTAIITLPVGSRPTVLKFVQVLIEAAPNVYTTTLMGINTSGKVSLINSVGGNFNLYFDGVSTYLD